MKYTISEEKLEAVTRVINNDTDPSATEELIKSEICADWNEGTAHQQWIDTASVQEIAEWLSSFYSS